jgi:hypothetical protein
VIGRGTLRDGNGAWTSYYDDGKVLAKGWFANNDPHGTWRFYHPSGRLAAVGDFWRGTRTGRWEFFHDSAKRIEIAAGRFDKGEVAGVWRHFDAAGKLIAVSHAETPSQWKRINTSPNDSEGQVIDIVPGRDRVQHAISIGTKGGEQQRLDTFALGRERIYVHAFPWANTDHIFDAAGRRLQKEGEEWTAADCRWGNQRKAIAASGDVARMHGLLYRDRHERGYENPEPACGTSTPISAARAARIDALLASREQVRSAPPAFVRNIVLGDVDPENHIDEVKATAADMTRLIAEHMGFYVEWPHIDGRFIAVFRTLPGHVRRYWWDEMDEPKDQP